jgi:hypothetical protein
MKYLKNKICVLFALFVSTATVSQSYKDDISVVLYTAEFIKNDNFSLKTFKEHNTYIFYLSKDKKIHANDKIMYLPTLCLFNNGELIEKIESGIAMKLPESTTERIQEHIDELLSNKF